MKRARLYNTSTGKWELYEVTEHRLFGGLGDALRRRRAERRGEAEWELDPGTLTMRDRRAERRWLRLARRAERLERVSRALTAMVEMQRHIG